tara:strand:- start:180 stop:500 length:321 start_codon:yes stop_codon:yes gene_type:complete
MPLNKTSLISRFEELDLIVLGSIHQNIINDQRKLSKIIGASLGRVNYCVRGLLKAGFIKIENFSNSENRIKYVYILTPSGIEAKILLTKHFLKRKLEEYEKIQEYL